MPAPAPQPKGSTGLPELDPVLLGGLPRNRLHLLERTAGTGTTTIALSYAIEEKNTRLVVIDSRNSFLATMPQEQALILQMHELLIYLCNQGVVTLLVMAQTGILGDVESPLDLSFLSDTIVLLRFFEAEGSVRKAVSVVKKRSGRHGAAIRGYRLAEQGPRVGPRLLAFDGVLTGLPTCAGPIDHLLVRGDRTAG